MLTLERNHPFGLPARACHDIPPPPGGAPISILRSKCSVHFLQHLNIATGVVHRDLKLVDYRNSIVATWNATDQEVSQVAEYDPNGVVTLYDKQETPICNDGNCPNVNNLPFGFTSALRSPVTGLIHMRARWYSPQLGQFISPDPLGYIDSYNLYSYALFDPINNWDPYGLSGIGFAGKLKSMFSLKRGIGERLENSAFVQEGFGRNDDPSSYRIGGLPGLLRDGGNNVDAQLDAWGADLHRNMEKREARLLSRQAEAPYDALNNMHLTFHYMDRFITPESGDELRLEMGLLPLGPAIKGGKSFGKAFKKMKALGHCSFTEDTPVLMCDGSLKPIQHVSAGELVLSRSEETGEFGCREVVEPYSNPDKAIIRIELLAPDGSLEVIEATANHPFYVEGQGWTRVDELDTNDLVHGSTGELLRIVALESTDRIETVFNFGVEEFHSYFVGELGAWVHNCFHAPWKSMTRAEQRHFKHVWDRANQRGWNLGHFREGSADDHRKAINSAINYVKDNASSIEHSSNMFNNKRVPTTTYRWNSSPDGPVYWVTEITDGKIPHSLGISQ